MLGDGVTCVDKHGVPRGTPEFEVDTATLSELNLLLHHTVNDPQVFSIARKSWELSAVKISDNNVVSPWQPNSQHRGKVKLLCHSPIGLVTV